MVCSICKNQGHNKRSCKEIEINVSIPTNLDTVIDYSKKTIPFLKNLCKELKITGFSRKKKHEIIELLQNFKIPIKVDKSIHKSKNSLIATAGNRAEDILCNSPDILECIGLQFFGKKNLKCEKLSGRKKSDVLITFEDGIKIPIQVKTGNGGGRGWSFDRRSADKLPTTNDFIKEIVKNVCLRLGHERSKVSNDKELIKTLLLGEDENSKPQYFIHININNNMIQSLSICKTSIFIETILKDLYENCNAKKTCVHLTPLIYLQRKGGTSDHSPDDIQAKLRIMPDCMTGIKII